MLRQQASTSPSISTSLRRKHGLAAFVAIVTMLLGASAWADDPCASLSDEDTAKYSDLNGQMVANYKQKEWNETIKAILALRQVCDEDPTIQYNLARAYHRAGNCNKALYWYESIQNYNDPRFAALVSDLRNEAAMKVAELEIECSTSAKVSITCSDPDVWVTLGDDQARPCPYEERVEAGNYKLRAVKQGLEAYEIDVALRAGEANRIIVPKLSAASAGAPDTGTLKISCPEDVSAIAFRGPTGLEEVNCPFERALPPGTYQIGFAGTEPTEPVNVGAGKTVALELSELGLQPVKPIGIIFGLRALPGLGMGDGELYTPAYDGAVARTKGMQPSGLTFGIVIEGGYAINDYIAVLVQSRIDVVNVAAIVGVLGRYTAWSNGKLSVRVDAGVGYGELLIPMVNDTFDGDIKSLVIGPAYGSVGAGVAWAVADPVSIVVEAEVKAGFPDFGLQFDTAGVGMELEF